MLTIIQAWGDLATATTGEARQMGLLNEDLKLFMKPLHRAVKDASLVINASSWSHLALAANTTGGGSGATTTTSGTMGPPSLPSLPSLTSKTQPPKFFTNKSLAANSGGGSSFPGPINTALTPSVSFASQFSAQSSAGPSASALGYITPVPATPLSAALGAAAQATVPNTPNQVPPGPGGQHTGPFAGNVFERADRLLQQVPQRRI